MSEMAKPVRLYDGDADGLMERVAADSAERILLLPDRPADRAADTAPRIRVMWGQHLVEDVLAGRYCSLVCAVNAVDNSRGIIAQLAELLPTSQWDAASITAYAQQFATGTARAKVLKYDMDAVEVLAILRPPDQPRLRLSDLKLGFGIVAEMLNHHSGRWPSASVNFLGAQANQLLGEDGQEPRFESVLRTMHEAGYYGDVYPSPAMWRCGGIGVFPRYPYPRTLDVLRNGGS